MANRQNDLTDKIRQYIEKNPKYLNEGYQTVADKFGVSYDRVRHVARRLRAAQLVQNEEIPDEQEIEEPTFSITEEVLIRRENAMVKSLKRQLESTLSEYDKLNDMYDVALGLKIQEFDRIIPSINEESTKKNEACAMVSISDGHYGKIILANSVNGLNEYNPDIARARMKNLAQNTIKLIRNERNSVNIDSLYLDLGGDAIDNSQLHDHSEMGTPMSPFEETLFARELISGYIKTVAEYGDFKNIIVSCIVGNHPRISKKMSPGLNHRLSHEYMMYHILKSDFTDSIFQWHIPESDISEVEIYGKTIRSFHGHQIRSMGGIGGLTIPLNKFVLRMDQISPAFYNYCHHFHQLSHATANCTVNGAICGYDAYAYSLGCTYDVPKQSFMLLDRDRGMTIKAPIFLD